MVKDSPSQVTVFFGLGKVVRTPSGRNRIAPVWHRVLIVFGGLFVAVWLLGAGGLYLLFKFRHEYDDVRFSKMLILPLRLDEHREEMGSFHIQRGMELLNEGQGQRGFRLLRLGLARDRSNAEARQVLASIYTVHFSRPDMAADVLRDGFRYRHREPAFLEVDYLRQYLQTLMRFQLDREMITEGTGLLEDPLISRDARLMIALGVATAHGHRGEFRQAYEIINRFALQQSPEGVILMAHMAWIRGNREEAIQLLSTVLDRRGYHPQIFRSLMNYFREMDRHTEIQRRAGLLAIERPDDPDPAIQQLYSFAANGEERRIRESVEELIFAFDDESTLEQLALFASNTSNVALAEQLFGLAEERQYVILPFFLHLTAARLQSGEYDGVMKSIESFRERYPLQNIPRFQIALRGLEAVAMHGQGRFSEARPLLREFLDDFQTRPEFQIQIARFFRDLGSTDAAREILEVTAARHPYDQRVVIELVRLDIDAGATDSLLRHVRRLLSMRIPEREFLEQTYRTLGGDRFLFTAGREDVMDRLRSRL